MQEMQLASTFYQREEKEINSYAGASPQRVVSIISILCLEDFVDIDYASAATILSVARASKISR